MSLLSEYAITPDVFFSCFYSSSELEDILISTIAGSIMDSGLVRDLRNGEWFKLLDHPDCHLSPRAKQFVMMLYKENRLQLYPAQLEGPIVTGDDWCKEALASDKCSRLTGIMTTEQVAEHFKSESQVAFIKKIVTGAVDWWQPLKGNVELERDIQSYLFHLGLILRFSNSLLFVDPYLDPSSHKGYANFPKIISVLAKRDKSPPPTVQIHRQGEWDKKNSRWLTVNEWKTRFNNFLLPVISDTKLKIDVFIWKKFHDRYLLSDLTGIQMSNGFDEKNPKLSTEITTWSRLDKKLRENLYRTYHPASRRDDLIGRFTVEHN